MTAPAIDSAVNIPALLKAIAPLVNAHWDEGAQTLEIDGQHWSPHESDLDAADLASQLGVRFKSNAAEVLAYIGDSPSPDSGSVVARSPVVDGDKKAAARLAALCCAALYAKVPQKYRPDSQPQAAQSQPVQQQVGVSQGITDLIGLPVAEWPVETRKQLAEGLRLLACVMESGI